MVVDRYRENFLGVLLADDVLVQNALDFFRFGQAVAAGLVGILEFFANDVVTELDALVADKNRRAGNQLADFVLAFPTERTIEQLIAGTKSAS